MIILLGRGKVTSDRPIYRAVPQTAGCSTLLCENGHWYGLNNVFL